MEKRIIYTRVDGGITILTPVKYDDEFINYIKKKDIPNDATNIKVVDATLILSDRTFRDAWEDDSTESPEPTKVNMTKARDIHMGRIRVVRDKRLNELDKRNYGSEYDAERQTLRDVPQSFNLSGANTPSELKVLWPEGLAND